MTCYGPIAAYRPPRKEGGDRRLVFDKRKSETGVKLLIPCGKCSGCQLDRAKNWAIRCMHEKQMHVSSSFLTLTYDDGCLPEGNSLRLRDYQLFLKRARRYFGCNKEHQLRFCGCGEYGETTGRPHYHVLFLSHDFSDRKFFKMAPSGSPLYTSKILDGLWEHGFANIGNVDYDSCCYVARYVLKKAGKLGAEYIDPETGLVREPEFMTMSRRPGLGSSWYEKYGAHAYEWDSVIFKGVEVKPPRFYDDRRVGPAINDKIRLRRRRKAALGRADCTLARLRVREVVMLAKLKLKGKSV